jgi:hypothetical protein
MRIRNLNCNRPISANRSANRTDHQGQHRRLNRHDSFALLFEHVGSAIWRRRVVGSRRDAIVCGLRTFHLVADIPRRLLNRNHRACDECT